jgi:hypothetical protein
VATPGVLARLAASDLVPAFACVPLLDRHFGGDWGVLPIEDHRNNDLALDRSYRLLSAYDLYGTRYWVLTEGDRSAATVLLPEEC